MLIQSSLEKAVVLGLGRGRELLRDRFGRKYRDMVYMIERGHIYGARRTYSWRVYRKGQSMGDLCVSKGVTSGSRKKARKEARDHIDYLIVLLVRVGKIESSQ